MLLPIEIAPPPETFMDRVPAPLLAILPFIVIFPPEVAVIFRLFARLREPELPEIVIVPVCPVVSGLPLVVIKTAAVARAVSILLHPKVEPDALGTHGEASVPEPEVFVVELPATIVISVGSNRSVPTRP
jgi:hypothetical protein